MKPAGVLLALLLGACSPVQTGRAPATSLPSIVSLNPCTDAILAEVADPVQILAISAWSHDPASSSMDMAEARRFRATNGSVEEVLVLRPDLIVGGTFTPPATRSAYARLGLRLEEVGIAATVEDSFAQVRHLAALAGHPERGEALVAQIIAALARAAPPAGARPVQTVLWEPGGIVPGDNTLVADVMRRAGLANFTAGKGMKQADYLPLERLLADPPALVLTAGNPRAEENRLLGHPALAWLTKTRREAVDPSLLYCGGPTIIRAARRFAEVRGT
ncbi:ABC transporter substrate-binding protein [Novosphingobium sp.]|uniref:ABC transporter substrate-binding protein n=1 Tax=Novosphingobium sp. TaxID=1874826 RepID=UPI00286E896A|nr:ABC transporter substrate-binding protein [Novosphingobium sp.]